MKLQQIILTATMAAILTACGGGSDSNDTTASTGTTNTGNTAGTGATTGIATETSTDTTALLAYTVYKPDLSTSAVDATINTNGATVTNSIPLTSTLTATFTTSDNGANYTWGGAAVGGGSVKADGNIALVCAGSIMQSGYAAISSNLRKVTDLTQTFGKTFTESTCNAGPQTTTTIAADGSITNSIGDSFTASQASQFSSPTGLTGPGGSNYRATFYSFTAGTTTRYFYVIQADESAVGDGKHITVAFQK
ncbi:MAG: hypothetical protein I8H87_11955 [Comamonadaceae bacterium]|jgi:hypothetical protein|nr:hypothetical protein [Comamonadaceae bacterium]